MDLISKFKDLFEAETAAPVAMKDYKSDKGLIIRVENGKASIISEDGTIVEAPKGDYKIDDNTTISVGDAGQVIENKDVATGTAEAEKTESSEAAVVQAAEVPKVDEAVVTDAPAEEPVAVQEGEDSVIATLQAKTAELEAALNMIAEQVKAMMDASKPAEELATQMSAIKEENAKLKAEVKEIAEAPAVVASNFKRVEASIEAINKKNIDNNTNKFNSVIAKLREETGNIN